MSLIKLQGNASGTGALTIAAPNTNTDRTLTLPDTTGTIVMNEGSGIFKIDSSGKVGIGTSSPAEELHLQAAAPTLRLQDSDDSAYTNFIQNSGGFRIDVDPTAAGAASFFRVDVDATERMRIDSLGRVGIGTSSPSVVLDVVGSAAFSTTGQTQITLSDSDGGFAASKLNVENGGRDFRIAAPQDIIFETVATERARIDSDGNLLVGLSTSSGYRFQAFTGALTAVARFGRTTDATARSAIVLYSENQATGVGSIQVTNTATSYVTSSDYRLKENVQPMTGALDKIAQLNPVTYTWKADGTFGQGFIAHELQAVVPDCVTGEKDAIDEDGNPDYQGVDTSFLVATLVKAIQEQQSLITDLTARLTALEAN